MGGLRFLITIFVVYLIFRSIMRRVLAAVNQDGDAPSQGKVGGIIFRMKQEMDRARRDAQREASGDEAVEVTDEGSWEEPEAELLFEGDDSAPRERWDEVDETPSFWDRQEEKSPVVSPGVAPSSCRNTCHRRRRRIPLKQALIWKEILDAPVGLRP